MSVEEQSTPDASKGSAGSREGRRSSRGWIVAGLVLLTASGLTLAYSLWWTKPTTFTSIGNVFGFKQTTRTMHPVTVDMVQRSVHADPETIKLNDVRPRVVMNSADALITFAVCTREGAPTMAANGRATRMCDTVTAVDGQQVRLIPEATTTITMTVTPQRRGRVVIRGMTVDYSRGPDQLWQRGSQATGPVVKVHVAR